MKADFGTKMGSLEQCCSGCCCSGYDDVLYNGVDSRRYNEEICGCDDHLLFSS